MVDDARLGAFDLRNQKIEQRMKELRRQRFEKQEKDFLQNHRTWEMQQAAKKAEKYSRYANSGRPMPLGPSTTMYAKQMRILLKLLIYFHCYNPRVQSYLYHEV
jgi:hypothetical protein